MTEHASDSPTALGRDASGRARQIIVEEASKGERLDRFLVGALPEVSRSQIQRLIGDGHVHVARKPAKANLALKPGDVITVDLPTPQPAAAAPEDLALPVLFEDADLVVIDKPAGMVVHPSPGHVSGTLVNALLHHVEDLSGVGGELRPGIVHRLDRGTSGVMVVAKHDAAHRALAQQFHDRTVEKEYIALVWGGVQAGRRIEATIGRDPKDRKKMSTRARRSREAVTRITRAQTWKGLSLVQVAIHTGRTHQIRVHLSGIGHPVVGDSLYGGVHRRVPGDIRAVQKLDRPFLHALRLSLTHPADNRRLTFVSPLPPDLTAILDALGYSESPDKPRP